MDMRPELRPMMLVSWLGACRQAWVVRVGSRYILQENAKMYCGLDGPSSSVGALLNTWMSPGNRMREFKVR